MKSKERKLLIVVDGSPQSLNAVRYVAQNHTMEGTTVTLMYFMPSVSESHRGFKKSGLAKEEMEANVPQLLRRYIEHLQKAGGISGRISTKVIMESSNPSGDIRKEAKERGYGTIVIGRRGLSTKSEGAMGGIAEEILAQSEGLALCIVP